MFPFLSDFFANSDYSEIFLTYWNNFTSYISGSSNLLYENQSVLTFFESFHLHSLYFDQFQLKLLKTFFIALIVNILLIGIAWKIYGRAICERFMQPATSKAIDELKASVSKLKLPKEHTPRI
ncbi:hypothetical protein RI129_003770 [Pyrocoelia pectoralis]|uniref:Uncharacterized protein n=1 Tax=Pyrocoelia pectoralis TaxID=417401 RepID=A0AAN7ZVF6_9COLE